METVFYFSKSSQGPSLGCLGCLGCLASRGSPAISNKVPASKDFSKGCVFLAFTFLLKGQRKKPASINHPNLKNRGMKFIC